MGWFAHKLARHALAELVLASSAGLGLSAWAQEAAQPPKAASHVRDCSQQSGVAKARCERHEKMAARCGSIRGEAHFVCDREFLLQNPLDCQTLEGSEANACRAELRAFAACQEQQGREFVRCVRREISASPMGH